MSQYPSPYTPPNPMYYAAPPAPPDVLAAARRASLLMFILGGLTFLLCTCMLASIVGLPAGELREQMEKSAAATGQPMPFDADQLKHIFIAFLAVGVVIAMAFVALGFAVRRGGKAAAIASIILTGLMLAFLCLEIVGGLVKGFQSPAVLAGVCMMTIPLALLGLMMIWLIGAVRAMSRTSLTQQQYAAQYWQYQQNMQAYAYAQQQQQGYPQTPQQGYVTAPPPIAPPLPAPLASIETQPGELPPPRGDQAE